MSILDISKTFIYGFHYEKIVSRYGKKAKLLMTDMNILVYLLVTADVCADVISDLYVYDTNDYPQTHPAYS